MNRFTVYKHTSPSGKVYIGITGRKPTKRFDNGKGYAHSPYFSAAIKKYGWPAFKTEILFSGLTQQEAENMEVKLIAEYKSNDRQYGYNCDAGGRGPHKISDETRAKMSERMKGDRNPSRIYGSPIKGKKHTDETKRKMSIAASARVGRVVSDATRLKLRQSQITKPVIDLDTGTIYPGIHEAAEKTGLSATKICAVCKGRRKKTGGKRWAYAQEVKEAEK